MLNDCQAALDTFASAEQRGGQQHMEKIIHTISEVTEAVFPPEILAATHYWFMPLVWAGFLFALVLSAGNRRD